MMPHVRQAWFWAALLAMVALAAPLSAFAQVDRVIAEAEGIT
jgi:hypothetical protein